MSRTGLRGLLVSSTAWIAVTVLAGLTAGCGGVGSVSQGARSPLIPAGKQGVVHGGQQPVVGAMVQLYAVGTTGDGSAATALLTPAVTTDANGGFTITGLYTCPSATALVYLVATGGNPGLGGTVNNSDLVMMAALGECGSLTSSTYIVVNELTTVAAVYSLAPFMLSATQIGSGSSDATALASAFTLASELVNTATGTSPGTNVPAGMQVPTEELATLADILASCVNTSGGAAGDGSGCGNLFALTTPGSTAPTNTIAALLNLANNPTLNTSQLFALAQATGPFQPILASTPASFATGLSGASLILYPSSLSFGTEPVGGVTAAQTVTLANTTAGAVTFGGIWFGGADGVDFAQMNNCPGVMAKGTYCTISVTFSPTAATARSAAMDVSAGSAVTNIQLSGTGETAGGGPVTLSPTSLSFYGSMTQAVTVSNYGTGTLGIAAIDLPAGYTQSNTCGGQLSGQSVCTIYVTAAGISTTNGMLTVVDTDTTDTQTVALSTLSNGTLENFGVAPYPYTGYMGYYSIGFGGESYFGYFAPYYLYGDQLTLSGPEPYDFEAVSGNNDGNGCSYRYTQQVPENCGFEEGFEPSGSGYRAAEAVDSAGNQYLFVGYGAPAFTHVLILPTPSLSFGTVPVGTTTTMGLGIENGSQMSEDFTVHATPTFTTGGTNNNEFSASAITCSYPGSGGVGAGITTNMNAMPGCASTITFTPKSYGLRQATVTVEDATGFTASTTVVGYGGYAGPMLRAAVLFGNVQTGASATQTVTATMANQDPAVAQVTGTGFSISGAAYCAQGASSCQFGVQFAPTATGNASGTLTVTDTATGLTASSALAGIGGVPTVSLSTNSVTFLPRTVGTQSLAMQVTLTNNGNAPLNVSSISVGGTNPGDFAQTNTCTASAIQPMGTCTISITNDPTFVGSSSASISIVTNAPTSPDSVGLTGMGQ